MHAAQPAHGPTQPAILLPQPRWSLPSCPALPACHPSPLPSTLPSPALPAVQEGGIDLARLLDEEGFYVRERRMSAPIRCEVRNGSLQACVLPAACCLLLAHG